MKEKYKTNQFSLDEIQHLRVESETQIKDKLRTESILMSAFPTRWGKFFQPLVIFQEKVLTI